MEHREPHQLDSVQAQLAEEQESTEISDGFHTMAELYEQRALYHALYVNLAESLVHHLPGDFDVVKSWRHHDGEPCFGYTAPGTRWFIVTMYLPNGKQVTQHYPEDMWGAFHIRETEVAPLWDGHDAKEGNRRMKEFLGLVSDDA